MIQTLTFTCGHTGDKDIKGYGGVEPGPVQLKKGVAYWSDQSCVNCWKDRQSGLDDALRVKYDLPRLTGSDKQVGWAIGLRTKKILQFEKEGWADLGCFGAVREAKFWIETRQSSPAQMVMHNIHDGKAALQWYAKSKKLPSGKYVGGTKPHYTIMGEV